MSVRVVIPAAGRGMRLRPHTDSQPKALIPVAGQPLLWHGLQRLFELGVDEAVVVCGYLADQLRESLLRCSPRPELRFVLNRAYAQTNSIVSVGLTRQWWDEPFCLIDGDVLASRVLLRRVLSATGDILAVDSTRPYHQIDMKVHIQGDLVLDFGKDLPRERCGGEFFGISRWTPAGAAALADAIDSMLRRGRHDAWYELAIRELVNRYRIGILASRSEEWAEVDSIADVAAATAVAERE